uniref:FLYWCH-type domain-containing protein n=1 Tax=Trichuris muris TaxID=70415 RepID=A0A5S6Q5U9_TRIMR
MTAVQFMQERGLIHDRRICPRYGRYMVLRSREDRDDVWWRCGRRQCRKELLARTGTWLQGCEQPMKIMIDKYYGRQASRCCTQTKGQFPFEDVVLRASPSTERKSRQFLVGRSFYGCLLFRA